MMAFGPAAVEHAGLAGFSVFARTTADAQLWTGDLRGWRPPGSAQAREVKMWEAGF